VATRKPRMNERSVDFMLEEFRFLKTSYEGAMTGRNERFKNFINIIFGAGAIFAVIAQFSKTNSELYYSIMVITFVLYLYGLFVFSRLVAGSLSIEKYQRAIGKVRKYFVDMDVSLQEYLLVPVEIRALAPQKSRLGSGLLGTTAFTNSLLVLISGATLIFQVVNWQILLSVGIGLALALISWLFHSVYYGSEVKKHVKANNEISE